jgi:CubicO group peptidase (beta-lactamase class C family)
MGFSLSVADGDGAIVYQKDLGYRNIERKTMTNYDTYYHIASISKTVATITLLTLFEQGKFTFDQDISEILGYRIRNPNYPDTPITVAAVLSHTSSLRDGDTYEDFLMYSYHVSDP